MSRTKRTLKAKRRVSGAGIFLIGFTILGLVWFLDGAVRHMRRISRQENGLFEGEAIIGDGDFADTIKPSKQMILEVNPAGGFHSVPDSANSGLVENPEAARIPEGCIPIQKEYSAIFTGFVLRIDRTHRFQGKSKFSMTTLENKNDCYHVRRSGLEVQSPVAEAFDEMMLAYRVVTGKSDLMVYSTMQVSDTDSDFYAEELPDRATGLCIDLCICNADDTISMIADYDDWILNNAWNYGFVFSYPENGEGLTGIQPAPYHLRYVGKIHSAVMHEHNLTLPDYIQEMHYHPISNPYYYHDGTTDYSIYYVKANSGSTIIPVTITEKCDISGNNQDGFIVYTEGIIE